MSRRMETDRLEAELAGTASRVDYLVELMQRRSIGDAVSREEFEDFVKGTTEALKHLADTVSTIAGMVEGISDMIAESELCPAS